MSDTDGGFSRAWQLWMDGPHRVTCNLLQEMPLFCGSDGGFRTALFFGISLFISISILRALAKSADYNRRLAISKAEGREMMRQREEREAKNEIKKAQDELNLERAWAEYYKLEEDQKQAWRMLPELESIFLREWGYFRADNDLTGTANIHNLRKSFAQAFLSRYTVDAPILWFTERIEIREILMAYPSWPKPVRLMQRSKSPAVMGYSRPPPT